MTKEINKHNKFEQNDYSEAEQKFLPRYPEKLEIFRASGRQIVQPYLSHPSEGFSLRLREEIKPGQEPGYSATLKDMGAVVMQSLKRLEVPAGISSQRYDYYNDDIPVVRKLRAEPHEDVIIDFFEDGLIHAESESPQAWQRFVSEHGFENDFIDVTGDRTYDSEWQAHLDYLRRSGGRDALKPEREPTAEDVTADILRRRNGEPIVVTVGGRSGSGKSTLLSKVREQLVRRGVTTSTISTDSYNFGMKHLEQLGGGTWQNLDSNETYDLALCLEHVRMLRRGLVIPRHSFDFGTQEPRRIEHVIHPGEVILVEGIKAHHPDFREIADLSLTLPTPLATCIGRRILRDLTHRPRFNPSENLAYYLEYTEPEYRSLLAA